MTAEYFRAQVKLLHPDLNGGDTSRLDEFRALVEQKRREDEQNITCLCGCGRKLNKFQLQHRKHNLRVGKPAARFYSRTCALRYRFYRKRLSEQAATTE